MEGCHLLSLWKSRLAFGGEVAADLLLGPPEHERAERL